MLKKYGTHVLFEEYTYKQVEAVLYVHLHNGLNTVFFSKEEHNISSLRNLFNKLWRHLWFIVCYFVSVSCVLQFTRQAL